MADKSAVFSALFNTQKPSAHTWSRIFSGKNEFPHSPLGKGRSRGVSTSDPFDCFSGKPIRK